MYECNVMNIKNVHRYIRFTCLEKMYQSQDMNTFKGINVNFFIIKNLVLKILTYIPSVIKYRIKQI